MAVRVTLSRRSIRCSFFQDGYGCWSDIEEGEY